MSSVCLPVIASVLQIRPKLDHQFSLTRKMALVDAVQEVAMVDGGSGSGAEWLSQEYKEILRDQETIRCAGVLCSLL
jgi:hypothetical protein